MQTTKALTKRVFPAHKKYLLFNFYPTQNLIFPRSFLLEKGKSPGDKVVFSPTDHELYTVAKTIIDHVNTSRLGASWFISATFHLSLGEYL